MVQNSKRKELQLNDDNVNCFTVASHVITKPPHDPPKMFLFIAKRCTSNCQSETECCSLSKHFYLQSCFKWHLTNIYVSQALRNWIILGPEKNRFNEAWMERKSVSIYSIFSERDVGDATVVDYATASPVTSAHQLKVFIVHFLVSVHRYDVTCYIFLSSFSIRRIKGNTWRSLFLRLWMIFKINIIYIFWQLHTTSLRMYNFMFSSEI